MPESFLVHFILNTLLPEYGLFKISYNTRKDKWSINELMTMCVGMATWPVFAYPTLTPHFLPTPALALEIRRGGSFTPIPAPDGVEFSPPRLTLDMIIKSCKKCNFS